MRLYDGQRNDQRRIQSRMAWSFVLCMCRGVALRPRGSLVAKIWHSQLSDLMHCSASCWTHTNDESSLTSARLESVVSHSLSCMTDMDVNS